MPALIQGQGVLSRFDCWPLHDVWPTLRARPMLHVKVRAPGTRGPSQLGVKSHIRNPMDYDTCGLCGMRNQLVCWSRTKIVLTLPHQGIRALGSLSMTGAFVNLHTS